ncbi:MAG TPA: hypothetical protein VEG08_03855 [Terriglobales bacterium]|nr:hypothetical protein [Terriglobales bacterium]
MSSSRRITTVFSALLLLCLAGQALSVRRLDRLREGATLQEVLWIPSPKIVKRLSLGYTGLMADIYWTRAVQYFGGKHHARSQEYKLLEPLLDITTTLDPHLVVAYQFGSIFISQRPPQGAGDPDAAAAFVERGIRENPDAWRLYYGLGFIHYLERHDYKAAQEAFQRGSQVPGAHPFMKVLAASMAQRAGERETAFYLWTMIYDTSTDRMMRDNALRRLESLRVDDDVDHLEALVRRYQAQTGHPPASWFEMIAAGELPGLPLDPLGKPYKLAPGGRVEVQSPGDFPFITRGLPPGVAPSPLLAPEAPPPGRGVPAGRKP